MTTKHVSTPVGNALAHFRSIRHMSIWKLSLCSGVSQYIVYRVERYGKDIQVGTLARLCGPLGVSLEEFMRVAGL